MVLWSFRHSHISHNSPCLITPHPPPLTKMCVTLTFHYSWVLQPSQEKQNWGEASWGNLGDVRVADVMPVNCNKQEPCYGSTIKISLNPFWVLARKCIVPQIFLDRKRFANIWSWEKRGNENGSNPDHSTTVNSSQCFSSKEGAEKSLASG